jgi:cytochrome c5
MKQTQMSIFFSISILAALSTLCVEMALAQGMMGGSGGMMGGEGMREMMQNMMGDVLPPPMDPTRLPEPDSEGARLLQKFCSRCHHVPGPGLHTAAEWPAVIERMNRRMQMMGRNGMMMMGRIEAPAEGELAAILAYFRVHAQKPLAERLSPALESEAGQAFRGVCSQCHALPDPGQHPPKEWPAVVERMKAYMDAMGKPVPDEKQSSEIIGFLQRYSGKQEQSP